MNYKCINAACGWEGKSEGVMGTWFSNKPQDISIHCIKCGSDAVASNYTRVPPTEPGYYWRRHKPGSKAEVYRLFKLSALENDVYAVSTFDSSYMVKVGELGGEWSERIEPPE